ncbi:hypothetical protein L6452_30641 [Arctium lappa]|uniref:Uncharacterized protein n=1 Tax=Arctium lappa TaxID=4217 RepID=A0ACB8ZJX7_ARCLA|nr:hypothetical protein L6452_30641 [Arctium lappa]
MKASEAMMEVEVQMLKKREKIVDELEKFGTFSETEMFNALLKITKDSESVITFWSLKETLDIGAPPPSHNKRRTRLVDASNLDEKEECFSEKPNLR